MDTVTSHIRMNRRARSHPAASARNDGAVRRRVPAIAALVRRRVPAVAILALRCVPAVAVLALLAWCAPASRAAVVLDFEQPVFMEPWKLVKDHTLLKRDGLFHLYYIRHTQETFGYATSPDLRRWTIHEPVLETGPESWDSYNIWAPCITIYPEFPNYLLMYYTGVNDSFAQRTCLALTREPSSWRKSPSALFTPFHGDTAWTFWREDAWSNYRDPCFFRENGACYLIHTAVTSSRLGTIAVAASDDYFAWRDAGPLYIHDSWHALESPFLLKRNGRYHLFFTEETVGGVSHMSSDSMTSGWDIVGRIIVDEGHAAELTDIDPDMHLFSRHTTYSGPYGATVSSIRFDTLRWEGDTPIVVMPDPLAGDWEILWGEAFDHQPVFGDNPFYRGEDTVYVGFEGNWWIGTYESFCGPFTETYPGDYQGDGARGAIRSRGFTVSGSSMRLLVGGGCYPDSCYVALCEEGSGKIIYSETGCNTDYMNERLWDLIPYHGRCVYLLIVDNCAAPFGHINVDGIEERNTAPPPPPDDGNGTTPIKPGRRMVYGSAGEAAASPHVPGISGYPNPFNPVTEITVHHAPGRRVAVAVFSVGGREITRIPVVVDETGRGRIRWNGCDRHGRRLPSGVYIAALISGGAPEAVCKLVLLR